MLYSTHYKVQALSSAAYYKWCYLDIHTDDNDIITIVFHENHMFCCTRDPSVSLSLYNKKEGLSRFYDSVSVAGDQIKSTHEGLILGQNHLLLTDKGLDVSLNLPRVKASFHIEGLVEQEPIITQCKTDSASGHWWCPLFIGQPAVGFLEIDGKLKVIHGTCYHDYNYGEGYLGDALEKWFWGRGSKEDLAFIYLIQFLRSGQQKGTVIMRKDSSRPISSTNVFSLPSHPISEKLTKGTYFRELHINTQLGNSKVDVDVQFVTLIDSKIKRGLSNKSVKTMNYYRIISNFMIRIAEGNSQNMYMIEGLTEQMHF